jgi:hypothetical protein
VAAVLDGPVTAVVGQDGRGIGAVRGVVGEAVDGFGRTLAGGFRDDFTFDDEGLADARKVEVVVETGGGPDRALFDAAMRPRVSGSRKSGCARPPKIRRISASRVGWLSLTVKT